MELDPRELAQEQDVIIVGVIDGRCRAALAHALDLALTCRARVRVLHGDDTTVPRVPVPVVRAGTSSVQAIIDASTRARAIVIQADAPDEVALADIVRCTRSDVIVVDDEARVTRTAQYMGGAQSGNRAHRTPPVLVC